MKNSFIKLLSCILLTNISLSSVLRMNSLPNKLLMISLCLIPNINSLKVLVLTQNLGGLKKVTNKDGSPNKNYQLFVDKLEEFKNVENPDLIILGVQEIVELKASQLVKDIEGGFFQAAKKFLYMKSDAIINTDQYNENLKKILETVFSLDDYTISCNPNITMSTYIIVKNELKSKSINYKNINYNGKMVSDFKFNDGFFGQKGGSISLIELSHNNDLYKFIHVNAHLDSKESNKRTNQFLEILGEVNDLIKKNNYQDYTIFVSGDMNSRLSKEEINQIKQNLEEDSSMQKSEIYQNTVGTENEEFSKYLVSPMIKKLFPLVESEINFPPTYKLVIGESECWEPSNYSTCYDNQIKKYEWAMAYTDRIFHFIEDEKNHQKIKSKEYDIIKINSFSDHFTVYQLFDVDFYHKEEVPEPDESEIEASVQGSVQEEVQEISEEEIEEVPEEKVESVTFFKKGERVEESEEVIKLNRVIEILDLYFELFRDVFQLVDQFGVDGLKEATKEMYEEMLESSDKIKKEMKIQNTDTVPVENEAMPPGKYLMQLKHYTAKCRLEIINQKQKLEGQKII